MIAVQIVNLLILPLQTLENDGAIIMSKKRELVGIGIRNSGQRFTPWRGMIANFIHGELQSELENRR